MDNYQLSNVELLALRLEHRRQLKRSGRAADRVKAVYLLGSNWSMQATCEALLLDEKTVRNYFCTYREGGIEKLLQTNYEGSEKRLTTEELKLLDVHLQEVTYARVKDIVAYVEKEFGESYSISGMTDLLKSLGYSYHKPTKVPYKVDREAQKKFLRFYKKLRKSLQKGDGIYFMDAVHPQHSPIAGYGWIKRGQEKALKSNPIPERFSINGAINIQNLRTVISFENRLNKETTKDFLEKLRKHQPKGWIHLICDNGGYYTSPEIEAYAESMAIKVIYLPPYSPNLNLIERLWHYFQKAVLHNRYYETLDDMKKASWRFFSNIGQHYDQLRQLMTENFQLLPT